MVGVLLLIGTIIPGVRLYWPRHKNPATRSDLGIALMGGALIAFAVLGLQLMIQFRAESDNRERLEQANSDARQRQEQADRQALLLLLGRSENLSGVDLHEEDLSQAYLNAKELGGANLAGANMVNASLLEAKLVDANLAGATLDGAHLDRADLRHADLSGASLVGATLTGASLDAARLSPRREGNGRVRVDLSGADLSNAWVRADLRGADLSYAILVGTRFAPANLQGAEFNGADLEFADLRGADLRGANLDGVINLEQAKDLSYAEYDALTIWPFGFTWYDRNGNDWKPTCAKSSCTLVKRPFPVTDFPPPLEEMRAKLVSGDEQWSLSRRVAGGGHAAQDRGARPAQRCRGSTSRPGRSTAGAAQTTGRDRLLEDQGERSTDHGRDQCGSRADRVRGALRQSPGRGVRPRGGRRLLVRGSVGFKISGAAPPTLVDVYQHDFLKVFRALGVRANVFPSLRGGEDGCAVS